MAPVFECPKCDSLFCDFCIRDHRNSLSGKANCTKCSEFSPRSSKTELNPINRNLNKFTADKLEFKHVCRIVQEGQDKDVEPPLKK